MAFQPMPLSRRPAPFDHPEWVFELKYDGFRSLAVIQNGRTELVSRNGHPFNSFDTITRCCVSTGEGDCLAAKLRPGNVHSAEDWDEVLLPEIERQQALGKEVVFRADAAFAKPEIYESLEERGVKYVIRLPANDSLERDIEELLTRPVGRPSHKPESHLTRRLFGSMVRRIAALHLRTG